MEIENIHFESATKPKTKDPDPLLLRFASNFKTRHRKKKNIKICAMLTKNMKYELQRLRKR